MKFLFIVASLFIISGSVLGNSPPSSGCSTDGPTSCKNMSVITNTCCFEAPGGLLYLSQTWDTKPGSGPMDSFTINGLLSENCDGTFLASCDSSREYVNIRSFLNDQGYSDVLKSMETYWVAGNSESELLWEQAWGIHGTCMSTLHPSCLPSGSALGTDACWYFSAAMKLFQMFPTYSLLATQEITPSETRTFTVTQLISALKSASGYLPALQCDDKTLIGIRWYFNLKGNVGDGTFVPIDAPVASSCDSDGIKYLPKVPPKVAAHALSCSDALELVQILLKQAQECQKPSIKLALCDKVDAQLKQMKQFVKRPSLFATNSSNSTIGLSNKSNTGVDDQAPLREAIARAYLTHAQLMVDLRCPDQAQLSRSRADKWGDIPSLTSDWYFPELDGRVANTPQLVSCLALLKEEPNAIPDSALEPVPRAWRKKISQNPSERERLEVLATDLIRAFTQDEFKDRKVIAEVICLVPVLEVDDSRFLLGQFLDNIKNSSILSIGALRGLAHVLRAVAPDHLFSQDLIEVLGPMSTKLQNAHSESPEYIFELTVAVSSVLDAMTDAKVTGIKRVEMHEPLLVFLASLRNSDDPHLKFHASYAFQALLCVPNDESPWEATVRRTTKVVKGISGLVSAVKGLDLNAFMTGLQNVQEGFDGIQQLFELGKTAYEGVSAVYESEQDFVAGLKEGLTFNRTRAWYRALRGADTLLEGGELTKFKDLVCGAVCRCEVEFQWGVCQRLGRVAANSRWGIETRQGAVRFLEEIYRKDAVWGYLPPIKSYIIELLKQLSVTVNDLPEVSLLIKDLAHDGDAVKREVYRSILEKEAGPGSRLAVSGLPEPVHSPLLDRVQGKTDVKIDLRRLARQRIDERGGAVYVPPMAKRYSKVADSDDKPFPLEPMVDDFLKNNQKVLLLRGVSGAGKTTFNRQLDLRLWEAYLDNPETSRIPLLINLPAINRPEHDLIAKHLRICEFSESQIHELKSHEIVVICDGYDEVRQSQNLYDMNEFNKLGGWRAQMIVGCRSEHLGQDYLHLFQPDRTNHADPESFQQAVLVPFSMDQVNEYIEGYVKIKQPVWGLSDYKGVLEQIPSLQDLVTNPFLLSLSLEVLPRITEPNQRLAANKITRVLLYDEFVTQWLERNKKRVATLSLTDQERKAFESLSDDGFTQHGLDYLKNLSAAIYDEQDGNPIVEYSKARDASTWKEQFFGRRTEETHLLRMSIPMTRSGGRFGFVHRSILEYGVCRAICEPQKQTGIRLDAATEIVEQPGRRMSVGSIYSFDMEPRQPVAAVESVVMSPEPDSPLVRRSFVKDASVIHFLVERVQSEPTFRDQLQCYIEASKLDKKWRTAAANAISILVRAGVSFSHQNLRGIKIPGADVSQGVFDSAELQDADLRRANFLGVRLRQADLSRALLSGSLFGELPLLSDAKMSNASACTPDGTRFVTGTRDGRILVYNTLTWTLDTTLSGADGVVTELAVSRDSSLVASSSDSTEGKPVVMVWQLETGVISHTFENHGARYQGLVFLPTGHYLAMVSNQAICLFDLRTGAMNKSLPQTAAIDSAAISCTPDGRWLAVSFKDGSVRLLDSDSLECHYTLYGLQNLMSSMTFSSDGKYLAVVSNW
ncbi:ribonuclease T2-like [Gryganskiella cystojenkinii]|nr:ribonuclease T2-like [Gryganskiella cystojenkinii]